MKLLKKSCQNRFFDINQGDAISEGDLGKL
jgi:hypothetical protein